MFFLAKGTRTSYMLRLLSMFADRLCRPYLVASGQGIRRSERLSIVRAALTPSRQGEATDVLTLTQVLLIGKMF